MIKLILEERCCYVCLFQIYCRIEVLIILWLGRYDRVYEIGILFFYGGLLFEIYLKKIQFINFIFNNVKINEEKFGKG